MIHSDIILHTHTHIRSSANVAEHVPPITDWFTHCQNTVPTTVFVVSMPTQMGRFTGTNAENLTGRRCSATDREWRSGGDDRPT